MASGHKDWATKQAGRYTNITYTLDTENYDQTLFTVSANSTFYMTSAYLSALNQSGANALSAMFIKSSTGAIYSYLNQFILPDNGYMSLPQFFTLPYEIPSLYEVHIWSTAVALYVYGSVTGYEILET